MGGCYVGKWAGARRHVARALLVSHQPHPNISPSLSLSVESDTFVCFLWEGEQGGAMIADLRPAVTAERLGMLRRNTCMKARRPVEAG